MPEYDETIELPDQDQADLAQLYAEPDGMSLPSFHPVLEVWREVLKPALQEAEKSPTPQWCTRILAAYIGLTYGDMLEFRDRYFDKIKQLRDILELEIESDPVCLKVTEPAEDVVINENHYLNLMLLWQMTILDWELEWDCQNPDAAVELAAIGEVHKLFLGQQGIIAFLDNIQFQFVESDQALIGEALLEMKGDQ